MKENKLLALALVRASVEKDEEALRLLMVQNAPSPELVAHLVSLTAGVLEEGLGPDRARAALDGWMTAVLQMEDA